MREFEAYIKIIDYLKKKLKKKYIYIYIYIYTLALLKKSSSRKSIWMPTI